MIPYFDGEAEFSHLKWVKKMASPHRHVPLAAVGDLLRFIGGDNIALQGFDEGLQGRPVGGFGGFACR
jgi:hypothetical protein